MKLLLSISCIFLLLLSNRATAQVDLYNNGTLYVSINTDTVYINGNFTNASVADLTNNGRLYVRLNLTNDQLSMVAGTGTLLLNGTVAQVVNGSQPFKTYNLITNNSAGITLNTNLSVAGIHTYTSGMIVTSATPNYLIYEAGSSYAGSGDSRHVNGWVKKFGNTSFTFPVGDATYERPVGITNLSATSEMNCKYSRTTPNKYNLSAPLVAVDSNEYWQINKISGGTAQVAMNWTTAKVPFYNVLLTDITSAYWNGLSWTNVGGTATGAPLVSGNITSNAVSSFGRFTFGYKSFPVPLKLISFTAERRSGITYLNWITDNEKNVGHFEIQRSDDNSNYVNIGTLNARNSGVQEHYNMEDHSSINGIAYYRLRSVDIDGTSSYSRVIAVSEKSLNGSDFLVINPVRTGITIFNKTGREGEFTYRLFTTGGQMVMNGNVHMTTTGGAVLQLPGVVSQGIYVLELTNDNALFRQKIVVEK